MKLPKIELPKFDGTYLKWRQFNDMFNEVIHKQNIPAIEKFWYLRANLTGEAEGLIKHLPLSAENYSSAWDLLTRRYDNPRLQATALISRLLGQATHNVESSAAIKSLHDITQECILGLENINVSTNNWDPILLHILVRRLDKTTHALYEQSLSNPRRLQTIKDFLMFLETRFQSLEAIGSKSRGPEDKRSSSTRSLASTISGACICCKDTHPPYICPTFLKLSPSERLRAIQKHSRCINCLQPGHIAKSCTRGSCRQCSRKHNTLLHLKEKSSSSENNTSSSKESKQSNPKQGTSTTSKPFTKPPDNSATLSTQTVHNKASYMMLSTVLITVKNDSGQSVTCRAILDSGSQINIVTESLCKKLNLNSEASNLQIQGIGSGRQYTKARVNFQLLSRVTSYTARVEAFVLQQIISQQPTQHFDISSWNVPHNIQLADPEFFKPSKVELLLGVEFYHQLMSIGQIKLGTELPILQNTVLGWIVTGRIGGTHNNQITCGIGTQNDTLSEEIERFWRLDNVPSTSKYLSPSERLCEAHFAQRTTRDANGRFEVSLPFNTEPSKLGQSKEVALRRFYSLEKKLLRQPELQNEYIKFMTEYLELGHMEEVTDVPDQHYYLPHHCVVKPESATTKLRVVFDASAKTTSNLALNDILMTGPTLQEELFSILLRSRIPRYVLIADLEKMFRQIKIHEPDRKFQLIFWRDSPEHVLKQYQLNTVTYGTRSAPYLATKTLQKLAKDAQSRYPLAAKALLRDCYVDDIITGSDSLAELLATQSELISLLGEAGFNLRKWSSNHEQPLKLVPSEDVLLSLDFNANADDYVKTLGLVWNPKVDEFRIKISSINPEKVTKRTMSSEIFRIFDPLGLVGPVVASAKIILKQVWRLKLDWDAALPEELHTKWIRFREELKCIEKLNIPRHVFAQCIPRKFQLHVFADASKEAYGAAIYIRSIKQDRSVIVRLLCSKSRVAPPREICLPRLELCAAKLATDLHERVSEALNMSDVPTHFWSDSTIVLAWINSESSDFHTFVANRIGAIHELSQPVQWHHVPGKLNPADLLTRPMSPSKLQDHRSWFYGPLFLHDQQERWPTEYTDTHDEKDMERKVTALSATEASHFIFNIQHGNSFRKLLRIVGYTLRFIDKCRKQHNDVTTTLILTQKERQNALRCIIKVVQADEFKDDIKHIRLHEALHKSNPLIQLAPVLDDDGILRVGGRLEESSLPVDAKHPMLLPYSDPITRLIMEDIHQRHSHVGPQALLSITRQKYWPLKGKTIARSIVQKCVRCARTKPKMLTQIMGNLPSQRIQPARPFVNSGVDFCGPVYYHFQIRGKRPQKTYVAVFVCFASKAVHLELVSDLSTNAFLGALRRFISRRGHCRNLFCDNATNFVGAKNQLQELNLSIHSKEAQESITANCSEKGIDFHFIPPRAPHFGGLWEAAVKSAKTLLLKTTGNVNLTHEMLETVLVEIEAILNSRPLIPLSSNPNDLAAITPGDLLIGEPLTAQVDPDARPRSGGLTSAWSETKRIRKEFWQRWSKDYLHHLQNRYGWKSSVKNIELDTLVIIKDDDLPIMQWSLGRVIRTYKGKDGFVRVVDVKTAKGVFTRPIHRLAPLPVETSSDAASEDTTKAQNNLAANSTSVTTSAIALSKTHTKLTSATSICLPSAPKAHVNPTFNPSSSMACTISSSKTHSKQTPCSTSKTTSLPSTSKVAAKSLSNTFATLPCVSSPSKIAVRLASKLSSQPTCQASSSKRPTQDSTIHPRRSTTSTSCPDNDEIIPRKKKKVTIRPWFKPVGARSCPADESTSRKTTKVSRISLLASLFIVLSISPISSVAKDVEIQQFNRSLGIHYEDIGTIHRIISEWKLIVYYDLSSYWRDIATLVNGTTVLRQMCSMSHSNPSCYQLVSLLEQDAEELQIDNSLFTTRRMKRGAINMIGNIANSLFGVLDSNYANEMSTIIDNIKGDQNHLSTLIKNQTSVVESTMNLMKFDQTNIERKFSKIDQKIEPITNALNKNSSHEFSTMTSLSLQLMSVSSKLHRTQSAIIDLLTDTHHGIINPLLLSPQQLSQEIPKIKGLVPQSVQLPIESENLLQLYHLMKADGSITESYIIFAVRLPLIDRTSYDLFSLASVPTNQNGVLRAIKLSTNLMAISPHRDSYFTIDQDKFSSCRHTRTRSIFCEQTSLVYHKGAETSACEANLFVNESTTTCRLEDLRTNNSWIQLRDPNTWIFGVTTPIRLQLVCGIRKAQITLDGSGLLKIQPDCVLRHDHMSITGHNTFSSRSDGSYIPANILIELPSSGHLLNISDNMAYRSPLTELNELQGSLINIKADENTLLTPHLQQSPHQIIPGYLSMSITTVLISLIIWKYWHNITRCIFTRKQSTSPQSTSELDFSVQV